MTADLYPFRLLLVTLSGWGQPPSTTSHRVPDRREPCSQRATEGATHSVDRRPAPTPRGEGPAARSTRTGAGCNGRDTRHDPAMALAANRPKADVRAKAPGPSRNHEEDLGAHPPNGYDPSWGYSRIQGALRNLDHRVARSTVAKVLRDNGIPPAPCRPSSWSTFLRARWGQIAGADFFTTEVWTARGLVTYYTLFDMDLKTRRVHLVSS